MSLKSDLTPFFESANAGSPSRLGSRYSEAVFLPEAGNTIVCHLDLKDPAHKHVLDARARMQALPGADGFLYTPVDSLHMTVFEGAIETRRTADAWPADLDRAAPIDHVTQAVKERLASFVPPRAFSVRVKSLRPTGLELTGATPDDVQALLDWRESLTEPFGYRHADHDAYRFHMTFAYPVRWLPDSVLDQWLDGFERILADLTNAMPVLPLRPPAFCAFADMTHFEELKVLSR